MKASAGLPRPPAAPRLRGSRRPLDPATLEDEAVYRQFVLEGGSLAGQALRSVSFEGGVFRGVTLDGSCWARVRLADVRLENCTFTNATWTDVALERVEVRDCRLLGWQAPGVTLRDVRFTGCEAPLSVWVKAESRRLWLEGTDLTDAVFSGAALAGAVLRGCRLKGTDFADTPLADVDLRGSDLRGVRCRARDVAGLRVEPQQLPDLAHLLDLQVRALENDM